MINDVIQLKMDRRNYNRQAKCVAVEILFFLKYTLSLVFTFFIALDLFNNHPEF